MNISEDSHHPLNQQGLPTSTVFSNLVHHQTIQRNDDNVYEVPENQKPYALLFW